MRVLEISCVYAERRGEDFHREIEEGNIGIFVVCDTGTSSLRWTLRVKRLDRSGKVEITPAEQLQSANPSPIMVYVHNGFAVLLRSGSRLTQIDRKLLIRFDFEKDWNHGRTMLQGPLRGQLAKTDGMRRRLHSELLLTQAAPPPMLFGRT